jgi:aminoglycoside/choline kinase family phosphotransferase
MSLNAFLEKAGWAQAEQAPVAADYSTRRFTRLRRGATTAILMQAGPDQKTPAFVTIDGLLRRAGIAAPDIYAADPTAGLVLMQDFGDRTLGSLVDAGADPDPLYRRAAELLAHLHGAVGARKEELPCFTVDVFLDLLAPYLDIAFPLWRGRPARDDERAAFLTAWREVLRPACAGPSVLLLRDYMLDNLMERAGETGLAATGVVDFQEGGWGPAAYDLASLAESVRREAPLARLDFVLTTYQAAKPVPDAALLRRQALVFAAHRHTRIAGHFTRYGETKIVERVRAALVALAAEPELAFLRAWV